MSKTWIVVAASLLVAGCQDPVAVPVESDTEEAGEESSTGEPGSTGIDPDEGDESSEGGSSSDGADTSTGEPPLELPSCADGTEGCVAIDLLVVVDNSATMIDKQAKIAHALPDLVERFEGLEMADGTPIIADVQVLITTTDWGNPHCDGPEGYVAAGGEPVDTGCNQRLDQFISPLNPELSAASACTDACPVDIAPSGGIVRFRIGGDNNVPTVPPLDIDGDGDEDDEVQRALACMAPQGVVGCGYESQLETMLQALDPMAAWNDAEAPFMRPGGILAVAIFTDEADCSVRDYAAMEDESYFAINPATGQPERTSALCWNAGVECVGPDANGLMSECSAVEGPLHDVSRYTVMFDYLQSIGKDVVMLGVVGVPPVTGHDEVQPYLPTSGGVNALTYRTWIDAPFPTGDIAPAQFDAGESAAELAFRYGNAAPGCHATNAEGDLTGFGLPPVRLLEVCQSLNGDDGVGCCLESICDDDYSGAMGCLSALVQSKL